MSTTNPFDFFFSADKMKDMMEQFQMPQMQGVDMQGWMDLSRKNLDAWNELNQNTFNNVQNLVNQSNDAWMSLASKNATAAQDAMNAKTPDQVMQKQAELAKEAYETTMKALQEMGSTVQKMNDKASDIVTKRMTNSMKEMNDAMTQATAPKGKKAA